MKHLSARWVAVVCLTPVLILIAILFGDIKRVLAQSGSVKGTVQIAFSAVINSSVNNLNFQSVQLNVISVRLNPHKSTENVTDTTPGWQTISVPSGTTAGETNTSVSFGTNFGPNGTTVGIGMGRTEMAINLSALQGSVQLFNTGKIKAQTYNWLELVLDPSTPGSVISQCGGNTASGEGCITYPLQFSSTGSSSIILNLAPNSITLTRKTSILLPIAIAVDLGAPPTQSNQTVLLNSVNICPLQTLTSGPLPQCLSTPPFLNFPGLNAGEIQDTVDGSVKKTTVNAEQVGTGNVIASVPVNTSDHSYDIVLPTGNYDLYVRSGSGHTIEAHSNVFVPAGQFSAGSFPSPDPFHFSVTTHDTSNLSGKIVDNCTGSAISGATFELFAPPSIVNLTSPAPGVSPTPTPNYVDCASPGPGTPTPAACTSCALTTNSSGGTQIPDNCVVIGTASSDDIGNYPLPGSTSVKPAFNGIPKLPAPSASQTPTEQYALEAIAPGYNTEILNVNTNKTGSFECLSSGFNKKAGIVPCNFSMPRGELDITASVAQAPTVNNDNVLVTAEDSGTFTGENVGMTAIQVGNTSNLNPLPLFVPANSTPTPNSTASPDYVPAPAAYDIFSSVQDLFGAVPQTTSGHTFGVLSAVPAPGLCATATPAPLSTMACVGHGSVSGSFQPGFPDQDTLIVAAKADPAAPANLVDVIVNQAPQAATFNQFAVCAPDDTYTITHYETLPSPASPTPIASAPDIALTAPTQIGLGSPAPTPLCHSICSDFTQPSGSTNACWLCLASSPLPNPL